MNPEETPQSVTVALGADGACPPVEWNGKTYRLGHPTQAAKAEYEVGLIDAERRSIEAQLRHGIITAAEAREAKARLGAAIDRGDHKTGKPLWLAYSLQHPESGDTSRVMTGLLIFLHTLFKQHHPEMTFADVQALMDESGEDLKLALRQVVPSFFRATATALRLAPEAVAELMAKATELAAAVFPGPESPTTPTPTPTS